MVGLWFADIKKKKNIYIYIYIFFGGALGSSDLRWKFVLFIFPSRFWSKIGFLFFIFIFIGSGNLRWKYVSKKIAMTVKELFEMDLLGGVTN